MMFNDLPIRRFDNLDWRQLQSNLSLTGQERRLSLVDFDIDILLNFFLLGTQGVILVKLRILDVSFCRLNRSTLTSAALTAPLAMSCLISNRSGLDSRFAVVVLRSSTGIRGVALLPDAARAAALLSSLAISSADLM
jgi:hypothetical protein